MCFYKINDLRHKMRHFTGKLIKLQTTQEEKVRFILHHWYQGRIVGRLSVVKDLVLILRTK